MRYLKLAGFAALPYLGGLLFIHAVILAVGAAVFISAVITATPVQVTLLAFLVLLYTVGNSALIAVLPNSSMNRAHSLTDTISSLATLCGFVAVVLIQYAQRRTALAREIIGGLAVLIVVLGVITPYAKLIRKEYPQVNGAAPVIIALDTRKPESPHSHPGPSIGQPSSKNMYLSLFPSLLPRFMTTKSSI